MSTAVSEPRIEQNKGQQQKVDQAKLELAAAGQVVATAEEFADPHPLLPVFVFGIFAFLLSATFVGAIVVWLSLRNSGVMGQ
jgi:hypothetical protein